MTLTLIGGELDKKEQVTARRQSDVIASLQDEIASSAGKIKELERECVAQLKYADQEKQKLGGSTEELQGSLGALQAKYDAFAAEFESRETLWREADERAAKAKEKADEEYEMAVAKVKEIQREMDLQQAFSQGQAVDIQKETD